MVKSKKRMLSVILMAGLAFNFLGSQVANGEKKKPSEPKYAAGEIIVKFKTNVDIEGKVYSSLSGTALIGEPSIDMLNKKHNISNMEKVAKSAKKSIKKQMFNSAKGESIEVPDLSNIYLLQLPKDKEVLSVIEEYKANNNVEYAEPNYIYNPCETIPNEYANRSALAATQWGLDKINAPGGWDIETGSENIIIAVIDTGVDLDHPDLANNILVNTGEIPSNGIDDDGNGYIDDVNGWDFVNGDSSPMDDNGHGTHCSGIVSAVTNNSLGVAGVSWRSKIMALKFLDSAGYGSGVDAIEAINYAADNGAKVISNSWGGSGFSQSLQDAINYAYSKGCVVIAAAGNDDTNGSFYPAAYDNVVAVAATGTDDSKADFSNYGEWVDVSAPGVDIYSTVWDNSYGYKSGTSMACPFVSGLAALIFSHNPAWNNNNVIGQIMGTIDNINPLNPNYIDLLGTGRINVFQALTFTPAPRIFVIEHKGEIAPDRTADVGVTLKNIWSDATGVTATLSASDPYVTVVSNTSNFGNISFQAKVDNSSNPFRVFVSPDCPLGHSINFTVNISADGGYSTAESIALFVHVPIQENWPVATNDIVYSCPALGDIDGDGDIEIVFGSSAWQVYEIYALHHDGTIVNGWPVATNGVIYSSPALGDIDGDGDIEIVVGADDNKIYALHHNGTNVSGWPVSTNGDVDSCPALGDIDGDGDMEIVVGVSGYTGDNTLYALHHDGTNVSGWPVATGDTISSSPALGDIDGDGDIEIVVGADDNKIYAFHSDGTNVSGWPFDCENGNYWDIRSSVALGDIDGDGDIEIVVGSTNYKMYALHHDGTPVNGWPVSCGGAIKSSPALGDIDGDGDIEIVVGTIPPYDGMASLYAFHHNGVKVSGWPVDTNEVVTSSPVLGDIDGDGDIEVIVGSYDHKVYSFHSDGTNVNGWPVSTNNYVHASPSLGDIDGDGDIEVVVGSADGKIYAWDCPGAYDPANIEWGTFHHDFQRTGLYGATTAPEVVTAVSSSDENSACTADKAIDGNLNTRWASEFSDPQWIYIDFVTPKTFNTVKLTWEGAYGKAYAIQISDDATNWTDIYSTTVGNGGVDEISVGSTTARYVRMYGTERGTGWGYSLYEFEVTDGSAPEVVNAVSSSDTGAGESADKAIDGDFGTRWSSEWSDPQWIYIDFVTPKTFNTVKLTWETAYGKSYKIQISDDAVNWTDIYSTTVGDGGVDEISVSSVTVRYVRMYGTERGTGWGYSLWEFEVY